MKRRVRSAVCFSAKIVRAICADIPIEHCVTENSLQKKCVEHYNKTNCILGNCYKLECVSSLQSQKREISTVSSNGTAKDAACQVRSSDAHISNTHRECLQEKSTESGNISDCLRDSDNNINNNNNKTSAKRGAGQAPRKPKRVFIRRSTTTTTTTTSSNNSICVDETSKRIADSNNNNYNSNNKEQVSNKEEEKLQEKEKLEAASAVNSSDQKNTWTEKISSEFDGDYEYFISIEDSWRQSAYDNRHRRHTSGRNGKNAMPHSNSEYNYSRSSFYNRERRGSNDANPRARSHGQLYANKQRFHKRKRTVGEGVSSFREVNRFRSNFKGRSSHRRFHTLREQITTIKVSGQDKDSVGNNTVAMPSASGIFSAACKQLPSPPNLEEMMATKYKDKSASEQNDIAVSIIQSYFITLRRTALTFKQNVIGIAAVVCGRTYLIELLSTMLPSNLDSSYRPAKYKERLKSTVLKSTEMETFDKEEKKVDDSSSLSPSEQRERCADEEENSNSNNSSSNSSNSNKLQTSSKFKLKWTTKLAEEILLSFSILDGRANYIYIAEEASAFLLEEHDRRQQEQLQQQENIVAKQNKVQSQKEVSMEKENEVVGNDRCSEEENVNREQAYLLHLSNRLRRNAQMSLMALKILHTWGQSVGDIANLLMPFQERRRNIVTKSISYKYSPLVESSRWEWETNLAGSTTQPFNKSAVAEEECTTSEYVESETQREVASNTINAEDENSDYQRYGIAVTFPVNLERYLTELVVPSLIKDLNEFCEIVAKEECKLDSHVVNSDDLTKTFNTLRQEHPHAFLSAVEVEAFSSAINVCTKLLTRRLFYTEHVKCTDGYTRYLHVHPPHWAHSLRTRKPVKDENHHFAEETHRNDNGRSSENNDAAAFNKKTSDMKLAESNFHEADVAVITDVECEKNNGFNSLKGEYKDQPADKSLCQGKKCMNNEDCYTKHVTGDQSSDNSHKSNKDVEFSACKGRIQPICLKSFVLTLRKFTRSVFALSESCAWKFDAPLAKNDAELWSHDDNENGDDDNSEGGNTGESQRQQGYAHSNDDINRNEKDNATSQKMKYGKVSFNFDSISPAILFMLTSSSFALLLDNRVANSDEFDQLANKTALEKELYIKETTRKMERSLTHNVEMMMKIMLSWMPIARTFQIATISTLYAKLLTEANVTAKNQSDGSESNPLRWPSTESSWNETVHGKTHINWYYEEEEEKKELKRDEVDSFIDNNVYHLAQMQEHVLDQLRKVEVHRTLQTTVGDLQNGTSTCATIHELFNKNMFATLSRVSLQKDEVLMNICASADASFSRFSPSDSAALCWSMLKIFHTIMSKTKLSDLAALDNVTDGSFKVLSIKNSSDVESNVDRATSTNSNTTLCVHPVNEPSLDRIVELQRYITGTLTKIMLGWVSLQIKRIRFVSWRMYECQFIHVTHPFASRLARIHHAKALTIADNTSSTSLVNSSNSVLEKIGSSSSLELNFYPDRKEYLKNPIYFPHSNNALEASKHSSVNRNNVTDMESSNSINEESNSNESFTHKQTEEEIGNNDKLEKTEVLTPQELHRSIEREWDAKVFLVCIVPWYYYLPWGVHRFVSTATFSPMEALTQFKASVVLTSHPVPSEQRESLLFFAHSQLLYETLEARQLYDVLNSYFQIAYKENIKEIFESNCVFLLARHEMKKFTRNELAKLIRILELAGLYSVMRFCKGDSKNGITSHKASTADSEDCTKQVKHETNARTDSKNSSNYEYDKLSNFATCEEVIYEIMKLSSMAAETANDIHIYSTPFIYYSKRWYLDTFSTHQSLSLLAHYLSACTYPTPSLELRIFVLSIAVRVANEFITTVSRVRAHNTSVFVDYVESIILPFYILCSIYLAEDERQGNVYQSHHHHHHQSHSNVQSALQEKISHALRGIHGVFEKMLLHVKLNNNNNLKNNNTSVSVQEKQATMETQLHGHKKGINENRTNARVNAGDVIELVFKSCALLSQCNCVKLPPQCITLIRDWASIMLGEASPLHFIHLLGLFTDRMYFNQNTSSYNPVLSITETPETSLMMSGAEKNVCNVYCNIFSTSSKQEEEEEYSVHRVWRQAIHPHIKATYNLYKGKGLLAWTLLPYMFAISGKSTHFCNQPLECMSMVSLSLDSLSENDFLTMESVLWLTKQIFCIDWMLLSSLPTEYALDLYNAPSPSSLCNRVNNVHRELVANEKTASEVDDEKESEITWQRRRITKEVQEKVRRIIYNNLEFFMHIKSDSIQPMLELLALLCKAETKATKLALNYCNYYKRNACNVGKRSKNSQINNTDKYNNHSCVYNNDCKLFIQNQYSSLLEDCVNCITQNEAHLEMAYWKSSDKAGRFKLIQPQVMCYIMEAVKELPTHEPLLADRNVKQRSANCPNAQIESDSEAQVEWRQLTKHGNDHYYRKAKQSSRHEVDIDESEQEQQQQQLEDRIYVTISEGLLKRNNNVKTKIVRFITPLIDISSFVICKHITTFSQYLLPFIELISEVCPHLLHEFLNVALGLGQLQNKHQNVATNSKVNEERYNEGRNDSANQNDSEFYPSRVLTERSLNDNNNSDYLESSTNEYEGQRQRQRTPRENRWLKQRSELLLKVEMNLSDMNTGADGVNKLLRAVIFLSNLSNTTAASTSKHAAPAKLIIPSSHHSGNDVADSMSSDEINVYDMLDKRDGKYKREFDGNSTNGFSRESNYESDMFQLQREGKGEVETKLSSEHSQRELTFAPLSERSTIGNSDSSITSIKSNFFNRKSESEECLSNAIRIIMELIEGYLSKMTHGAFTNIDLNLIIQVMKLFERKKIPAPTLNWIVIEIIIYVNTLCLTVYSNYAQHVHEILRQYEHHNNANVNYDNLHYKKSNSVKLIEEIGTNNSRTCGVQSPDGVMAESDNLQKESSSQEMEDSAIVYGKIFCYTKPTWWRKLFHAYKCEKHPLISEPSSEKAAKKAEKPDYANFLNTKFAIKNAISDCEVDWEVVCNIPSLSIDLCAIKSKYEGLLISSDTDNNNNNVFSDNENINDAQESNEYKGERTKVQEGQASKREQMEELPTSSPSSLSLSVGQRAQYAELSEFFSKLPVEMRSFNLSVWSEIVENYNRTNTRAIHSSSDRFEMKELLSFHNKIIHGQYTQHANEVSSSLPLKEEGKSAIGNEGYTPEGTNAHRDTATENASSGKELKEPNEPVDISNVESLWAFVKSMQLRSFYVFTALSATQVEHIQRIIGPLHFLHLTKEIVSTYMFSMSVEQRRVLNKLWRAHSNVWKEALKWNYCEEAQFATNAINNIYDASVDNHKKVRTHNAKCTKTPVAASVTANVPWWQKEPSKRYYPWILPSSPITSTVLGDEFIYGWMKLAWETLGMLASSPESFISVIIEQTHANVRQQEHESTSQHKRKRQKRKSHSSSPEELFSEEQQECEELEELEEEEEEYDLQEQEQYNDSGNNTTSAMNKAETYNSSISKDTEKSGKVYHKSNIVNDSTIHNDDGNGGKSFMPFDNNNKCNNNTTTGHNANKMQESALTSVVINMEIITQFLAHVECSQLALREREVNCFLEQCHHNCLHNNSETQKMEHYDEVNKINGKVNDKQRVQCLPLLVCGKCEGAPVQILKCITQNMITCKKEREELALEEHNDVNKLQKCSSLYGKVDWSVENYTSVVDYRKWCPLECTRHDLHSGDLNKEAIVTDNILTPMSKLSVRTRWSNSKDNAQNVLEKQKLQFNRMTQLGFGFSSGQSKNDQVVEHAMEEITNNWLHKEQQELDNLLKDSIITDNSSNLSKSWKEQRDAAHAVEPMLRKSIASLMPSDILRLIKMLMRQSDCYAPLQEQERHLVNAKDLDAQTITPSSILLSQQTQLTPLLTVQFISFFDAFTDLIDIATPMEIISTVNISMTLLVSELRNKEITTAQQSKRLHRDGIVNNDTRSMDFSKENSTINDTDSQKLNKDVNWIKEKYYHSDVNTREECVQELSTDQNHEHEVEHTNQEYPSTHSLLHSLRRFLSTVPLVIANDVERFTEREIAYLLIVLHEPEIAAHTLVMERMTKRMSVTERFVKFAEMSELHAAVHNSLFAHSLVSVHAIRAVENYFFAAQSEETLEEYLKYEEVVKSALRDGTIVKIWSRIQRNIASNLLAKGNLSNEIMSKLLIFIETTTHHLLNKQSAMENLETNHEYVEEYQETDK